MNISARRPVAAQEIADAKTLLDALHHHPAGNSDSLKAKALQPDLATAAAPGRVLLWHKSSGASITMALPVIDRIPSTRYGHANSLIAPV